MDSLQVGVIVEVLVKLARLFQFLGEHGWVKLVLAPIQFYVEQLVDDVADVFSEAW